MPALSLRSVSVSRPGHLLLTEVDLTIGDGQRIGLVGPNGSGKSTLLAAGVGRVAVDAGEVITSPLTATVGLLDQQPERSSVRARDHLATVTGVAPAAAELDEATALLATGADDAAVADRYDQALARWLALGGGDLEARIGRVADELGLADRLLDQPLASLSGGQRARVALAGLLLSRFDIVLLDEPTNDLDAAGRELLERWMLARSGGALVVSHDRAFLRTVVTEVAEIDPHRRRLAVFGGGWRAYRVERERAAELARERYATYDQQRRDLAARAQRQREWAQQGRAAVRRSGENDKFIRHYQTNQTEKLAARAAQTARAAERLERVDKPWEPWELRLQIPDAKRSGQVALHLHAATVERGEFRLGPVDLEINDGDRVALEGANGAGKTTLIELLLGRVRASAGRVQRGAGLIVGEMSQTRDDLSGPEPVLDRFVDRTGLTIEGARTLLAKFGLVGSHLDRPAFSLSPGERTRLVLAAFMAVGANLLVLDEPTNHLDLAAIEQLEAALGTFAGTLIVVSHDPDFVEALGPTRRLQVSGGTVIEPR